jgi:hypothetical protein
MKRNLGNSILVLLILVFISGCNYDCDKVTYTQYRRIVLNLDSMRTAVKLQSARTIKTPGALYYKDGFVYVNERGEGIHIIDNRQPATPLPIAFINIPGNNGLAARQNYLYADSFLDLIVFDISDPSKIKEVQRFNNAFNQVVDPMIYFDSYSNALVKYQEEQITTTECEFEQFGMEESDFTADYALSQASETGSAGSMARFVVTDKVLYTVDESSMTVFDVSDAASPKKQTTIEFGWGIETIFPHDKNLFIGSQTGMHIFDNANPLEPVLISTYQHFRACDPVVVQGDYAYVTLRDGNTCNTSRNQLDIVDLKDLTAPKLIKSYDMLNPHGLGINGACLFICEGDYGLKTFDVDASDPSIITSSFWLKDKHAFDVITLPNILMMVGEDGFYQYQYVCGENLEYLSKIEFGNHF